MFNVIIDTKEKQPWKLTGSSINEVVLHKLDTGDYTIQGYEHILTIERKKSTAEFAINIVEKRFPAFMQRMKEIQHSYMVMEFSYDDVLEFPRNSGIPKSKWARLQVSSNFMVKRISEYLVEYGVPIIFAGDRENAERVCQSIMKEFYEKYSTV